MNKDKISKIIDEISKNFAELSNNYSIKQIIFGIAEETLC
tara:strand:- start:371 stop:490 length:120 start_codon:yes stop_codon:yes gene_type:complete